MNKTVVFIHGAWMTPYCWEPFEGFFRSRGYQTLAPAWPHKGNSVEDQKAHPDPELAQVGFDEIVGHYDSIIRNLPEQPILIGHSFGGLFVQMLLDRGLGSCGVAIDSAPPKGVFFSYPLVIKSLRMPLTTPFGWKKILHWPFSNFQYAFVDILPLEQQQKAYDEQVVPESGRIFWQSALSNFNNTTKVNFNNNNRAPLLLIAGEKDKIVPTAINRSNYKKYSQSTAKTNFKEFPNRVHYIIAQPGWEEVAEYCQQWIEQL